MTSTCRDSNEGPMLSTHLAGCEAKTCAGCQPCGELHCTNLLPRGRRCLNHIEAGLICPSCIGKTRRDLGDIVDLEALLLPEAIVRGVNSEAAYLAGPAADPESWSWHKVSAKQGRIQHASLLEDDDELHPYSVLGRWDMMLREDYGPRTDLRVTIARAADYLDRILYRLAQDPDQDFPLFAAEMRKCRAHLEDVLHNSKAPETGAPCYMCGQADVERKHGEQRHVRCKDGRRNGCTRPDEHGYCTDPDGHRIPDDWWQCPECAAKWSPEDYRRDAHARYIAHAPELNLRDMEARTKIPYATLRRWAVTTRKQRNGQPPIEYPPRILPAYIDTAGRKIYRVSDVLAVACATVEHEGMASPALKDRA